MKRVWLFTVAIVMLLTMFPSCAMMPSDVNASYAFYVKDDQLVMMDTNTKKIHPLTQHLNTERDARMAGMVRLDEHRTRLFYLDRDSDAEDAEEYLFMLDLTKRNADAVKIDSTAGTFDVSKDGKTLVYLKKNAESGFSLYRYDGETTSLVADGLIGFGFTKNEDLPYYVMVEDTMDYLFKKEENYLYYLASDASSPMTHEEFETQTGGARPYTYAFEGISISSYALSYNNEIVDQDKDLNDGDGMIWTDAGFETYFTDRLLYFQYANGREKYNIKQYIKGGEPQIVGQVNADTFPAVAYTSDGLPLYLQNYDKETRSGQLMLYKDGEAILLDEAATRPVQLSYVVAWTYDLQKHISWLK